LAEVRVTTNPSPRLALPTGAGATLIRKALYFHDAATGSELLVLALYAGLGLLLFVAANAFAGAKRRHTALPLIRPRRPATAPLPAG
jgi:hypothetical protein